MIANIVDRRTNAHRWLAVDAVAEATWHDNAKPGTPDHDNADPVASRALGDTFSWRARLSVAEAVLWGQAFPDEVTLYLYDVGTYEEDLVEPDHPA
ncbi:MAG TPA: hypothetical protein VN018_02940 [Brevundimonas sp.]|nr:hypothetical protein [Brevundimonas sp.]